MEVPFKLPFKAAAVVGPPRKEAVPAGSSGLPTTSAVAPSREVPVLFTATLVVELVLA